MTGGGTGNNAPTTTAYVPFGGGSGGFGAAVRSASPVLAGVVLGFVGVIAGIATTLA